MAKLTAKDKQEVKRLSASLPHQISVAIHRSEDGGFVAEVMTFPGVRTQGETFSELIAMINDAMFTYFEVPDAYQSFLPTYLPTAEQAAGIMGFPNFGRAQQNVTMLAVGEASSS